MESETKWRTLGEGDVRPKGYWFRVLNGAKWIKANDRSVGVRITKEDLAHFEYRAPVADEAPAPPEGYEETTDFEAEAVIGADWIMKVDYGTWVPCTNTAGMTIANFRRYVCDSARLARPIRKPEPAPRSFWVPASVRQPPAGMEVPTWRDDRAFGWKYRPNNHPCHGLPGDVTWLDLDAAEAIATERDRLAAENERLRARVAELERDIDAALMAVNPARVSELESENDWLRRERDALVDGLCRQGEWFRGIVRGVMGAREVN